MLTRIFDFLFSALGIICLSPLFVLIYLIALFDTGKPFFIQSRIGRNKEIFNLIKFRTMNIGTKSIASHLSRKQDITRLGKFLRKTKIDELPQLWNVLIGEMSLVGPRPNLENQKNLIEFRKKYNIYSVKPGITGLSQINKIDMSTPELLAKTDSEMLKTFSIYKYFYYILKTIFGSGRGDAVRK